MADDGPHCASPRASRFAHGEVHHFLLPAAGWGAVADTKEAKEGCPTDDGGAEDLAKSIIGASSAAEMKRLSGLGRRVEVLWALAQRRGEDRRERNPPVDPIWGCRNWTCRSVLAQSSASISRSLLGSEDSAYRRLRRVMDAWAALWFWPVTRGEASAEPRAMVLRPGVSPRHDVEV